MSTEDAVLSRCPNCYLPLFNHSQGCVLGPLGVVLRDRGYTEVEVNNRLLNVDVDLLWHDIGPIIDRLEEGQYSNDA